MVITGRTRNFLKSWLFAPLKKPVKSGVFSGSKIEYFVVLSVSSFQKFLEEMRNNIHGELSEWSKVQHSKCCVPKRNLGFESLTLRHKACKQARLQAFSLTTSPKNGLSQTVFQRLSKSPFSGIISPFSIACAEVILEL